MANDEITEFLELEKSGFWQGAAKEVGKGIGGVLRDTAVQAGAALVTGGVVWGGAKAIQAATSAINRNRGYKKMLQINPDLGERDQATVRGMYNLMHSAAPTMAMNPYVSGGFIRRTEHASQYIDPMMVKSLSDAESSIQKARWGGFPDPMKTVIDATGSAAQRVQARTLAQEALEFKRQQQMKESGTRRHR